MTVAPEILMAYVDGTLAPDEAARVAAEIAADPALTAEVERQQALLRALQGAFAPVLDAPVPPPLIAAALHRPWYRRLAAAVPQLFAIHPWMAGGGLAGAGLAAGFAIALVLQPAADGNFAASGHGVMARAGLTHALETRLAAEQDANAATRIGLSFRSTAGTLCRTFVSGGEAGIACHEREGWHVVALAPTPAKAGGDYRMASGDLPDAVRDAAAAMMSGAPLTQRQEIEAAAAGWR